MDNLFIIGTLHNMMPEAEDDFEELLSGLKPNMLLVEISQDDLEAENFDGYPKEMHYAYHWAKERGLDVFGFDCAIDVMRVPKPSAEEITQVEMEQMKVLGTGDWKDANYQEISSRMDEFVQKIINPKKYRERQTRMLKNIEDRLSKTDRIVVVTGAGHLDFFQQHLPDAQFPLRKK